jgi:DNA-binding transcriptional LysR family regulator
MNRSFHPSILRLLRVFHAVAKYQGFKAAETVLNIGQPTISSHIKDLEENFGFEVCERGRNGFRLTVAGDRLYEATRKLESDLDVFMATVGKIRTEVRGYVRIGLTNFLATVPMLTGIPDALKVLSAECPSTHAEIQLDNPHAIEEGMLSGRYDLAISGPHLDARNIEFVHLFDLHMRLYCGEGHELFRVPDSEIDDALLCRYAAIKNSYDGHRQVPFVSADAFVSEASEASIFYVLSGAYLGYLNEFVAAPSVLSGKLRALRPSHYSYQAPGGLLVPERSKSNPAVSRIVELLSTFKHVESAPA